MQPVVDAVWEKGFNGTILAYGQTGSGKTHTLIVRRSRCWPHSLTAAAYLQGVAPCDQPAAFSVAQGSIDNEEQHGLVIRAIRRLAQGIAASSVTGVEFKVKQRCLFSSANSAIQRC